MTLGQLRYLITKAANGIDPDLLDGWIQTRYTQILDAIPWRRADVEAVLQTVAPYETGTLAVTNGATAVTLTGGTFSSAMTGRGLRVCGRDEYYEFSFLSATTGTLDRAYEGGTDSEASFSIWQSIYQLPADARQLRGMRCLSVSPGRIDLKSKTELDESAPARQTCGVPRIAAQYMDSNTDPPVLQVELYPIPDAVYSVAYSYVADQDAPSTSSASFLPWTRPGCLQAGVMADYCRSPKVKDLAIAMAYEQQFGGLLEQMIQNATQQKGAVKLRMSPHYTQHRIRRAIYSQPRNNRL